MKYRIFEEEKGSTNHAYDFLIEAEKKNGNIHYYLYRSDSTLWAQHCRGELVGHISDNGNGIKIHGFRKKMDYDESAELKLLMNCIELHQTNDGGIRHMSYSMETKN